MVWSGLIVSTVGMHLLNHAFKSRVFFSDSMNMEVASLKKMKNNDVLLTLPGTLKVRDIGWLSIWCKRFTVNYGEVYIPSDLEIPEKVVSTVIMK